ncbi:AraC family transcriptional regulator [Nocardia seriolae]|uniref:AraC family transcriptional regulator n=1 Tax=Nocardia seriolae TaxID=37332 RepID=A0ABC9YSM3_9NOCA|nr:AraC family transcriptional regulator [Nocardia seriolae]GAM46434.1 AraC family transcriptional regulator [Nocardia seriolae]GAP28375.1 AraC family transcriptional regulator [Nocardia seriolae]GEM24357.1 AraC family transcriptional regulator [Nocardia seriolae NBRC 15557]
MERVAGVSEGASGVPDPRLRAFVLGYEGYLLRGFAPGTHVGMPGSTLTVIVTIGEPIDIAVSSQPGQLGGRWDMLASGLTTHPAVIVHNGFQHGVQLNLTPGGCRALFGMPAAALGSWIVDLSDVLGPCALELRERLSPLSSWPQRFAVLDEILLRRVRPVPWDDGLARAWTLLSGPDPAVRVAAVADEIGWSRRHLGNRFSAEFGITPKDAVRVARFERSHRLLRDPVLPPLAEVAAISGYYDQAHMAREWRELAGMPPSVWREREEFPFVQDREVAGAGG